MVTDFIKIPRNNNYSITKTGIITRDIGGTGKCKAGRILKATCVKGQLNGMSRLTDDSIKAIFILYTSGFSVPKLSTIFDVPLSNIYLILQRKIWGHVDINVTYLAGKENNGKD